MEKINFENYNIDKSFTPKIGAFGKVYKVTRKSDYSVFAIKILNKNDENSVKRFNLEIKTIINKLKHQNIVEIVDYNIEKEPYFYVMPFADECLNNKIHLLNQNKEVILNYFLQILDGVEYAHKFKILHRDLKPSNILIFNEGEKEILKVADFGLLKELNAEYSAMTNSDVGTPAFMSHEQLNNWEVDETTDIYSLGKILYALFTNEKNLFNINDNHPFVPNDFRYIINKCIKDEHEKRYQSINELREAIRSLTSDSSKYELPDVTLKSIINKINILNDKSDILSKIEELDKVFAKNTDKEELYIKIFCFLDDKIIKNYHEHFKSEFYKILKIYDRFINKQLNFEYTDSIAIFYKKIFNITNNSDIKELILKRLLLMAKSHNRNFVRSIFLDIIYAIENREDNLLLKDILDKNKEETWWISGYIEEDKLPQAIKEIFKDYQSYSKLFPNQYLNRSISKMFTNSIQEKNKNLEIFSKSILCFYICLINHLILKLNDSNFFKLDLESIIYLDEYYLSTDIKKAISFYAKTPILKLKILLNIKFEIDKKEYKILLDFWLCKFGDQFDLEIEGKKGSFKISEKNLPNTIKYKDLNEIITDFSLLNFNNSETPNNYIQIVELIYERLENRKFSNFIYEDLECQSINFRS